MNARRVQVLQVGDTLIASIQTSLDDLDLGRFAEELLQRLGGRGLRHVVIDLGGLDVVDSYAVRVLRQLSTAARLRGARTLVAGIRPPLALALVQLGLALEVETALDLDDALEQLGATG